MLWVRLIVNFFHSCYFDSEHNYLFVQCVFKFDFQYSVQVIRTSIQKHLFVGYHFIMAQSTLFVLPPSPRSILAKALAKYFKVDVNVVDVTAAENKEFTSNFPLHKTPAFIGEDGFKLHELIAIAYYSMCEIFSHFISIEYIEVFPVPSVLLN